MEQLIPWVIAVAGIAVVVILVIGRGHQPSHECFICEDMENYEKPMVHFEILATIDDNNPVLPNRIARNFGDYLSKEMSLGVEAGEFTDYVVTTNYMDAEGKIVHQWVAGS